MEKALVFTTASNSLSPEKLKNSNGKNLALFDIQTGDHWVSSQNFYQHGSVRLAILYI
jgi:hypothetical protein